MQTMIDIQNFDFLIGNWQVENRRLKDRLTKCEEWIEFQAEMETKSILNGLALMDEMKSTHYGDNFIGLCIRMYNPGTKQWRIFWADTANPGNYIKEQVTGEFKNGIGEFYGTELYKGEEVKLRFIWKRPSINTAIWEQAYYDEKEKEWETNWTMLFTSIEETKTTANQA